MSSIQSRPLNLVLKSSKVDTLPDDLKNIAIHMIESKFGVLKNALGLDPRGPWHFYPISRGWVPDYGEMSDEELKTIEMPVSQVYDFVKGSLYEADSPFEQIVSFKDQASESSWATEAVDFVTTPTQTY